MLYGEDMKDCGHARGLQLADELWKDVRHALRRSRRSPRFARNAISSRPRHRREHGDLLRGHHLIRPATKAGGSPASW